MNESAAADPYADRAAPSHTPGPWALGDLDFNLQRIVRAEHIEVATCWHHCVGSIGAEMEANARLIAAAPDLLEALKRNRAALDLIDPDRPLQYATTMDLMRRDMDAAIAKATPPASTASAAATQNPEPHEAQS